MHLVFSILTVILIVKLFRALRWHRYHCGGGCGGGGRFGYGDPRRFRRRMARKWYRHARHMHPFFDAPGFYDPYDMGAPGHDDVDDFYGRPIHAAAPDVGKRVDDALRALELNERQSAEAGDALAAVRAAVGPERYEHATEVLIALRAAAKPAFDTDLAEAALGPRLAGDAGREAREALEHLHNILTEEQRAALLRLLSAK
jgi:hypothetical protein